jgi:putative hydrolase of the HAD superfamily
MPITAVILDYGNVLCLRPLPQEFEVLYKSLGVPEDSFLPCFWRYRRDYDRGRLDGSAYWQHVAHDLGISLTDQQTAQLIQDDVRLWQHRDPLMARWVENLRVAGVKTAVLSNMPRDVARSLRQPPSWFDNFDSLVLSSDTGFLKPEPEIYRICLDHLGVQPQAALFVDDHAENVEAAQSLGIHALKFESPEQFAAALAPFQLPALALAAG